jgi:Protein of unknown function (DUF551)
MSEWISVKDRLPDEETPVITLYSGVVQHITYWIVDGAWYPACSDEQDPTPIDGVFTHWMPLPEPPKEQP